MRLRQKIGIGIRYGWWALMISIIGVFVSVALGIEPKSTAPPGLDMLDVFLLLVVAPFTEELVFRFLPIRLTLWLTKNEKILWAVVVVFSILFGLAHSRRNLLVQGSAGVVFSMAFLRGGYWSSVSAHATLNAIALCFVLRGEVLRGLSGV